MDIADPRTVARALDQRRPWAVINTAGYVRVDDAEADASRCLRENRDGPALLASACADRALPLLTFSSDLVFDGAKGTPYVESDAVSPRGVYGRSKAEAERAVLAEHPQALVVRTSAFFGPWDAHNFLTLGLETLARGEPWRAPCDVVSPTYVPHLVDATLDLLIDGERGVWHLANRGAASWAELAREVGTRAGYDPRRVVAEASSEPRSTVLASERGWIMPTLDEGLDRYFAERSRSIASTSRSSSASSRTVMRMPSRAGRTASPSASSASVSPAASSTRT
jgi:dTDP-4-dehydrorhamnose reductase